MEHLGRDLDQAVARFAAAVESGDPSTAAVALGRLRGGDGIAIGPSIDDLETVHRIVTGTDPSTAILRAFADAWAESSLGVLLTRGALDHRTGLATTEYLLTRLRDLARSGGAAARMLVVADGPDGPLPRFALMLRMARVGKELQTSFPGAETPVDLDGQRVAVVVPVGDSFDADLVRARLAVGRIDEVDRGRVVAEDLPAKPSAVEAFVLGI
ncbi:MAG: hypothetical protein J7480_08060 [Microbacteriaceae bacterium]|nr:hypothetical protein [Microbacteriaceae bacterium]